MCKITVNEVVDVCSYYPLESFNEIVAQIRKDKNFVIFSADNEIKLVPIASVVEISENTKLWKN